MGQKAHSYGVKISGHNYLHISYPPLAHAHTHTHQLANYCGPHTTWVCTLAPSNLGLQRGNTHQLSHLCGRYKFIKLLGVKGHKKFRQLVTHTHTSLLINMSVGQDSFKIVTVPLKSGRLATMAKVVAVLTLAHCAMDHMHYYCSKQCAPPPGVLLL